MHRRGDFGEPDDIIFDSFDFDPDDFDPEEAGQYPANIQSLFRHDYAANDTKYGELRDIVRKLGGDKIIIFAFYKATLFYLHRRLSIINILRG